MSEAFIQYVEKRRHLHAPEDTWTVVTVAMLIEGLSEIERLRAEVAELKRKHDESTGVFAVSLDTWGQRCLEAEARAEKAEAALKPFAEKFLYPDDLPFEHADDIRSDPDWDEDANDMQHEESFTLRRDIRRAREALAQKEPASD